MIVTGFVELGVAADRPRPRAGADYRASARWLAQCSHPVVCFSDAAEPPPVITHPADFAPDPHDLDRLEQALSSGKQHIPWAINKDNPEYFCLMRHKVKWLLRASEIYGPGCYRWLDYGYRFVEGHHPDELFAVTPEPGRIRIAEISYVPRWARVTRESFYCRQWWPVAGGLLVGWSEDLEWLDARIEDEWHWSLDRGYALTDEMMLGWVRYQHPERFDVYYADHPTLIANYAAPTDSHHLIALMADRARADGDMQEYAARSRALNQSRVMPALG